MSESAETLGQRLQAARDKKGLSAQKVADELHLDGWVIEGLESGNYERIGPPVYAKGHLKRYAELLGLPVAEVLAGFEAPPSVTPPPPAQPAGMRMRTSDPAGTGQPWVWIAGCAVVVLVVAGIVWWRPWHRPPPAIAASSESATPSSAVPGAAMADRPSAGTSVPPGSGAAALPPTAAAPPGTVLAMTGTGAGASTAAGRGISTGGTAVPGVGAAGSGSAVSADPKAASGRARLRLSFLADSWVDVHDAAGQRLFAGNGHVNNVRSMSGEAPFRVYLKSASSIRLEINNHVVPIGPQFVVADAAHFEAGADGVLRRDPHAAPAK